MTATVHQLPGAANPATPPDMTDGELRAWWLGYVAGQQDRDAQYEAQDARLLEAIDKFLAGQGHTIGARPALKAVR